jgi:hypothetical protein
MAVIDRGGDSPPLLFLKNTGKSKVPHNQKTLRHQGDCTPITQRLSVLKINFLTKNEKKIIIILQISKQCYIFVTLFN